MPWRQSVEVRESVPGERRGAGHALVSAHLEEDPTTGPEDACRAREDPANQLESVLPTSESAPGLVGADIPGEEQQVARRNEGATAFTTSNDRDASEVPRPLRGMPALAHGQEGGTEGRHRLWRGSESAVPSS